MWKPKKCNCVFWAVGMQFLTGWQGHITIVKSNHWPGIWPTFRLMKANQWLGVWPVWDSVGFHVIWTSPDGQLLSYSPNNQGEIDKKQSKREILFEGHIKKHSQSDIDNND